MKPRMRSGHRLALVCIASVMTSLGSSAALADDGPIVTLDSAVDGVGSALSSDDPGDAVGTLVDAVSSITSPTVDAVSDAASGTAGAISDATSDAGQAVSGSAGALTDAEADGTGALGNAAASSEAGTASGTTGAAPAGSPAHGASTLSPIQRAHAREETRLTGALGEGPCAAHTSQVCSSAAGATPEDSLAEKVAEIIGLLALTGLHILPWVAAALTLTIVGSLALERGRPRRSETGHAPAA